jgi:excisionase family DNA binding protein
VVDLKQPSQNQWLSLGEASRILKVNEATLRQWGDNGYVTVYRTPGGHRRFANADVQKLTQQPHSNSTSISKERREDSALRKIRQRLTQDEVTQQSWYQSVQEDGKARMRLFGRRLLSLLLEDSSQRKRRQDALSESLIAGREYGTEMSERHVPLKDTIEALIFFRDIVLESASYANYRSWSQTLELSDHILRGILESYQEKIMGPQNDWLATQNLLGGNIQ